MKYCEFNHEVLSFESINIYKKQFEYLAPDDATRMGCICICIVFYFDEPGGARLFNDLMQDSVTYKPGLTIALWSEEDEILRVGLKSEVPVDSGLEYLKVTIYVS